MDFQYNDGGRRQAGFVGNVGDCVTRAIAIASGIPYLQVYHELQEEAKRERPRNGKKKSSVRNGVSKATWKRYLKKKGFKWIPTMKIGSGCKVHLRKDELPSGRLIVVVTRHLCAVVDGVIHDTFDPSRNGTRCVYGYYQIDRT